MLGSEPDSSAIRHVSDPLELSDQEMVSIHYLSKELTNARFHAS